MAHGAAACVDYGAPGWVEEVRALLAGDEIVASARAEGARVLAGGRRHALGGEFELIESSEQGMLAQAQGLVDGADVGVHGGLYGRG